MSPSFSHGARGQVYRYYVSAPLQQGQRRKSDDSAIRRVPAPALEALLADLMTRRTPSSQADPLALLTRVEVHASSLQLLMPVRLLARSEEHTSELQSIMRISYAVFCLHKKKQTLT